MQQSKTLTRSKLAKATIAGIAIAAFSSVLALRLTAQQPEQNTESRALPVRTTEVRFEDGYMARRTFTGRAVAGRTSSLAFELNGTVNSINVDMGTVVNKGAALATLDTSRLEANRRQLNAERDEAVATLDLAERTFNRATKTFDQGHASAQRRDEAEANAISLRARLKRLDAAIAAVDVDLAKAVIRAPFTGTITQRRLDEGTVVSAGTALLELTETSRMEAHIGMPPEHAIAVKNGAKYVMRDGRRNVINGTAVRSIVPVIEGNTRTMMVTFDIPADAVARGELLHASIQNWQEASGAWLPLRALSSDVRGLWRVYKVIDKTSPPHVRFENVQILYSEPNRAFVTGSISNGDIIISDGLERLAAGQRVSLISSDSRS
ncbi:MAG: efflux RND transporter periplasmic adaptor subunit [Kordiimonas sp.]